MLGIQDVTLTGKTALVTGAGGGIGKGIALTLANFGADVAVLDINEPNAKRTASEVQALGRRSLAIHGDVGRREDIERGIESTYQALGGIDILVNNAGSWDPLPAIWTSEQQWDDQLRIDLKSVFLASKDCASRWIQEKRRGNIVNMSSVGGVKGSATFAAYGAAKAGIINLTEVMALELGPYGIRVNCVAMDITDTEAGIARRARLTGEAKKRAQDRRARMLATMPLRRVGTPDDTAGAVLYLASGLSSWVTAQTLIVDGGAMVCARGEGPQDVPPLDQPRPK